MKTLRAALAVAAAAAALALAGLVAWREGAFDPPPENAGRVPIGGPFALIDGDGRMRTDSEFRGAPMLVSFGYTHCPDICPTVLQTIADALDALGPEGAAIQPLFVTVDPERDTPEVVRAWVGHFHERLIGLTGAPEQTAAAARAYRVTWRMVPDEAGGAGYLLDHTALVYLMDADGAYVTHFGHREDAAAMAARLARYLETGT